MSESKHTPGPWRICIRNGYLRVEADQGKAWNNPTICDLAEFDNAKANARLIAAAPELLTATKECADALANIINAAGNGQPYSVDDLVKLFADIRCLGDEAVAKATGERI